MKRIILIMLIIVSSALGSTGCYVDNYEMRRINNDHLHIRSNILKVGFAVNSKIYRSDNPTIVHRINGRLISMNTPSVGYDYIRKEAVIQSNVNIPDRRGKHTFELWINEKFVKKFTIGTPPHRHPHRPNPGKQQIIINNYYQK